MPAHMSHLQLKKRVTFEVIHIVSLSLLIGVVVMSGIFAAVLFPTMKRMDPVLPEFATYTGEHWRVAAGRIASLIFLISSWMQGGLLAASLAALLPSSLRARHSRVRLAVIAVTTLLLLVVIGTIFLPLQHMLHEYWNFAKQGDMERASMIQKRFDALHKFATPSMLALLAGAGACIYFSMQSLWRLASLVPESSKG